FISSHHFSASVMPLLDGEGHEARPSLPMKALKFARFVGAAMPLPRCWRANPKAHWAIPVPGERRSWRLPRPVLSAWSGLAQSELMPIEVASEASGLTLEKACD